MMPCDNWPVAVRTPSLSKHYRMNDTDVFMDISEYSSLWKEQVKCASARHRKQPLREQWCFPGRVRAEKVSSQHGLSAESPSCLVSHSQTACACMAKVVWIRETSNILPRKQKETQHKRLGFRKTAILTLNNFFSFSVLCNGEIRPLKVKQLYEWPQI